MEWLLLGLLAVGGFVAFEFLKKAHVHPNATQLLLPGHAYTLNVFASPDLGANDLVGELLQSSDLFTPMGSLPTLVSASVALPGAPAGGGGAIAVSQWHLAVLYTPKATSFVAPDGFGHPAIEHVRSDGSLTLPITNASQTLIVQDAAEMAAQ
jgi:hypothetical protein